MKFALLAAALIGATLLAYRHTIPGAFIFDDRPIIIKNPKIRSLKMAPIFGSSYWDVKGEASSEAMGGLYRPLTMASFALNFAADGLNPRGYHLVNLILHIMVSILVGILGLRLGFTPRTAIVSAAVFALLPVHTEAVSNIVGRSELLAALFLLLAWILFIGRPRWPEMLGGALSFILALLSKENAVSFLPVLIISDYVIAKKSWKALARERTIVWVICGGCILLYLEWRLLILGSMTGIGSFPYFASESRAQIYLTMSKFIVLHYLKPMLFGIGLSAEYTRPAFSDAGLGDATALVCALFITALFIYALYSALRHRNRIALSLILFGVFLIPVLHLISPLEVIGAERFLYLPSIGYCLGFGALLEKAIRSHFLSARSAMMTAMGMMLWYGLCTDQRNKAWASEPAFWETTLNDAPKSPRSWNGQGLVLMNEGKYDEAMVDFNRALALNPMLIDADYNLATCFYLKGNYKVAKRGYLFVLQYRPDDPDTLSHLADLSERQKDYNAAAKYDSAILAANPRDGTAQNNLVRIKGVMQRGTEVQP